MSSVKSSSSVGDSNCRELERQHDGRAGEIVKMGYLRKLKRLRKKFFVLRGESSDSSARLEYYDSEKKWRSNSSPKRSILLKTCFNINRRLDTKHKHVIALYTKDDCFCLVLESEEDLEDWLKSLLSLQQGEDVPEGELPKPMYEHVWQVTVKEKGLGNSHNILGPFRLCLTDKTLSLVKVGPSDNPQTYEFQLNGIRRCGHSDCFFYMEVGRSSCTGAGDLWMQTEDTNIAQNMHGSILHAMTANKEGSRPRTHSSPKTEPKVKQSGRNQSNYGKPPYSAADKYSSDTCFEHQPALVHNQVVVGPPCHRHTGCPSHPPVTAVLPSQRRHSVSAMYVSPVAAPPNHQRTYSFPLSDGTPPPRLGSRRVSVTAGRTSTTGPGRDRSDSMPSRNRTTSEGHMQPPHGPTRGLRPQSMYNRGISHSPPVGSSPVSPNSGGAYSDSAGSSLSIDESECLVESCCETSGSGLLRYSHSLTPDEPPIQEEMCDEYGPETLCGNGMPNHMRLPSSLTLPITTPLPFAQKVSPNLITGFKPGSPSQGSYSDICSPCSSSPLETSGYIAMSPGSCVGNDTTQRTSGAYSHSFGSVNHSRGSSLAEEPYVPMGPSSAQPENYVDMDNSNSHHFHHGEMSPSSSCSITSGTPSTDLRFSEYHLEKVSSYFTPSEDDDNSSLERPIRAYSVGSRPDTLRKSNRLEPSPLLEDNSRVRAFSVGSRLASRINLGRPRLPPQAPTPPGQKSSSAPLLSSSWSGSGGPMADLMELDFTSRKGVAAPPRSTLRHLVPPSSHIGSSNELQSSPPGPYLDMRPGSSAMSSPQSSVYVDTRPRSPMNIESGSPKTGPYVDMRPGSSPPVKIPVLSEIKAPKSRDSNGPGSKPSLSTNKVFENNSNYMEMTPNSVSNMPPTKVREVDVKPIMNSVKTQEHSKNVERKISVGKIPVSNGSHFEPKSTLKCGESSYNGMKPPLGSVRREVNGAYHDSKVNSAISRSKDINGAYAEMKPSPNVTKVRDINSLNSPDSKMCPSIVWPNHDKGSYIEMHPKSTAKVHCFPTTISISPKAAAGPYVDMKPGDSFHLTGANFSRKPTSPIQEEYVDMTPRREEAVIVPGIARTAPVDTPQPKKQTDGYVEMSWSRGSKPGRRSALEDYHPMSVTPPGFLPLSPSPSSSPSSSLQRTHRTKVSDLATPTAIFPFSLNSPSSPVKQLPGSEPNRKCSIDATSGTLRISQSPGSESSSSSEQPTPVNIESQDYVDCNPCVQEDSAKISTTGSKNSLNFANSERSGKVSSTSSEQQDYVNCLPTSQERTRKLSFASSESSPVRTRKISAPALCHTQVGYLQHNSSNIHKPTPVQTFPEDGSVSEKALTVSSSQCLVNPKEKTKLFGSDCKIAQDIDISQSSVQEPESHIEKHNFVNLNLVEQIKRSNSPVLPSSVFLGQTQQFHSNDNTPKQQTCSGSETNHNQQPFVGHSESPKPLYTDAKSSGHPRRPQDSELCRQLSRSSSTSSESGRNKPGPSKIPVSCVRSQDSEVPGRRLSRSSSGSSESGRSQQTAESPRPPSVGNEKELHYASLDLAPQSFENEDCCRSQRIPNDSPGPLGTESNSYAQIDFSRNTSRQMH